MRLGNNLMQLVPHTELLSAQSPLQDILVPVATLGMGLGRAYACDSVFGATVMQPVLEASGLFAVASVSGEAGRSLVLQGMPCMQ